MTFGEETAAHMALLRQSARPVAAAIERLLREGSDSRVVPSERARLRRRAWLGRGAGDRRFPPCGAARAVRAQLERAVPELRRRGAGRRYVEDGRPPRIPVPLLRCGLRAHAR